MWDTLVVFVVAPNFETYLFAVVQDTISLGAISWRCQESITLFRVECFKGFVQPSSCVLISELRVNHTCTHAFWYVHTFIYTYFDWSQGFPKIILFPTGPINLSKENMFFFFSVTTWVLTAAAVFSGRDVVCWSLLMKQKRFYVVAAVRAMRMFKLPCSNLRFGVTGCMLDLTLILDGSAPTSFCLQKLFSSHFSFFISKHPNVIFGEAAPTFFGCVSVKYSPCPPKISANFFLEQSPIGIHRKKS